MKNILGARLEPVVSAPPRRDAALEGLRGAAALAVLYAHLTTPTGRADGGGALDPIYLPSPVWWWFQGGTLAVLTFFLLSGHVIGLSLRHPFASGEVPAYLRRRAVRIIPIYLVAVTLGLATTAGFPLRVALGHLLFLQNDGPAPWVPLLAANPSLWSLPYEVVFYLAFPLLWLARPPLGLTLALCAGLCALGTFWPGFPPFPAAIFGGATFWIVGLATVWRLEPAPVSASEHAPWPSILLVALATWQLEPGAALLRRFGHDEHRGDSFEFLQFGVLPVLAWLLLVVARRTPPRRLPLELLCWIIPSGFLLWRAVRGTFTIDFAVPSGLLAVAALLRGWRPGFDFWRMLAPVGAISYGLYAIGYPVQVFVCSILPVFSGNAFTWLTRGLLVVALTFTGAWWLEHRLQPRVRACFR